MGPEAVERIRTTEVGTCFHIAMARAKEAMRQLLPAPVARLASEVLDHSLPARRRRLKRWRRLHIAASEQARVVAMLIEQYGPVVQAGPFVGLELPTAGTWGNLAPLLVGSYEEELHGAIEQLLDAAPDVVINVGCAEGYYAVGLARRLPAALVHAFDVDPEARRLTVQTAAMNNAGDRVRVASGCTAELLQNLVTPGTLLVIDCEGCELELLQPELAPALREATLLVEVHDVLDPSISSTVLARFGATHSHRILRREPRDPARYRALRDLNPEDQRVALDEMRSPAPHAIDWLVLEPFRSRLTTSPGNNG